jgi:hypothetical protein
MRSLTNAQIKNGYKRLAMRGLAGDKATIFQLRVELTMLRARRAAEYRFIQDGEDLLAALITVLRRYTPSDVRDAIDTAVAKRSARPLRNTSRSRVRVVK